MIFSIYDDHQKLNYRTIVVALFVTIHGDYIIILYSLEY